MNVAIHAGHAVRGSRGATGYMDEVKKTHCLYVTKNLPNCILFEVGFVSSKKDFGIYEKMHSKGIACVIADCVLKYGKELW